MNVLRETDVRGHAPAAAGSVVAISLREIKRRAVAEPQPPAGPRAAPPGGR